MVEDKHDGNGAEKPEPYKDAGDCQQQKGYIEGDRKWRYVAPCNQRSQCKYKCRYRDPLPPKGYDSSS
jgi:hypothetical protein